MALGDFLQSKVAGLLLAGVFAVGLAGAAYQWFGGGAGPVLEEIPQPNMEDAEAVVAEHVSEALAAARRNGDARGYGELGKVYHSYNYFDAAAACYRNAVELDPGGYRWRHLLSLALRDDGETDGALAAAEAAVEAAASGRGSDMVERRAVHYNLGVLYLRDGRFAEAENMLAPLSAADESGAVWYALGQVAAQVDRPDAAVKAYREAADRAPKDRAVLSALGAELRRLGEQDEARIYLQRAATAADRSPSAPDPLRSEVSQLNQSATSLNRRAGAASRAGNRSRAATLYRRALEADPHHPTARINLAVSLDQLGQRHQAVFELEKALEAQPNAANAHLALGRVLAKAGDLEEALERLKQARELAAEKAAPALWAAAVTGHARGVPEGLRMFDEALALFPGDEGLTRGKARMLALGGRYREAATLLADYVKRAPECMGCRHYLARLRAAAPDAAVRDGRVALDEARALVEIERDVARTETLAMALAETGDFAGAVREQRLAVKRLRNARLEEVRARAQERLALYEAGKPCREPWAADETYPAGIGRR